jgi:chitinase
MPSLDDLMLIYTQYNVQFYNQGVSEYTTCQNLFTASSSQWPNTAVFQLANVQGVPLNKIVVGKPAASAGDANNGYIDPSTFASCLASAKAQGWSGGAMFWQYPHGAAALAQTVRSLSWPVGSSPPPTSTIGTTTTKTTSTPTNTPTGGSGGCSGVSAWSSGVAYTGGQKVTYGGHLWTAKWWTQADTPGGAAGVWTDNGSC